MRLLLTGRAPDLISLNTPRDWMVEAPLLDCVADGETAACSVEKDGGDDVDATHGCPSGPRSAAGRRGGRAILGGLGVGRVTRPGLDQPVGEAAINSVPGGDRRAAEEEAAALGYAGGLEITISVPGGEEAAARTFNPQLGVEGGISILGTSGIVEPMSAQALVETIALELRQTAAEGTDRVVLTPGNYGADFLAESGLITSDIRIVKCSNFIGEALDRAAEAGSGS